MFNRKRFEALEHKLDMVYTALVVRDPGTALSAEAYEGLRRQVIAGAQERNAHLAQLVEVDVAARRGVSAQDLRGLSTQWMAQAKLVAIEDPSQRELFESSLPADASVEVVEPAYVDGSTGRLMRQGRLREVVPITQAAIEQTVDGGPAVSTTQAGHAVDVPERSTETSIEQIDDATKSSTNEKEDR